MIKKVQSDEQQQQRPGREHAMRVKPVAQKATHRGSGKLAGKVALITGGDSGIGRAVAIAFAKEGAAVAISYLEEHKDAQQTIQLVEAQGGTCRAWAGDVGSEAWCTTLVKKVLDEFGHLDILVNNAAEQHPQKSIADISAKQLERTFRTNIFAMFYLVKAALPHLKRGAIINTSSIVAYQGHPLLVDYAATKGAIVAFTRSLATPLAKKGLRVNCVAPGPIWTPLIPSTFSKQHVKQFGKDTPMGRPGQPEEVAPAFVFLASDDASYISGQTIHVNGGQVVNG